jgi:DNA-binding NarL/FixJ family response regulator
MPHMEEPVTLGRDALAESRQAVAGGGQAGAGGGEVLAEGRRALAEGRWADARDVFAAADPGDGAALDGLGEALWWLGEPGRALAYRERAFGEFRRAGAREPALLSAMGVAIMYTSNFDNRAAASGWMRRAARLLAGDDDPLAGWLWTVAAYVTTDLVEARDLNSRALARSRQSGDLDLELCALSGLGRVLVSAGEVEAGLHLVDEAMAGCLGGEYSRLDTVVYTSCDMLEACDTAADVTRARQWCQVADRFIARYGCPFLHARCRTIYGGILVATGDWVAGERELLTAVGMSAGAGPGVAATAAARLADLRLRQGRPEEAEAVLRDWQGEGPAAVAMAAVRLARGDAPGAVALLQAQRPEPATPVEAAATLALLVRARLARGELAEAVAAAETLRTLAHGPDPTADGLNGAGATPNGAGATPATTGATAGGVGATAYRVDAIADAVSATADRGATADGGTVRPAPTAYRPALAALAAVAAAQVRPGPAAAEELTRAVRLFASLGLPYEAARARLDLAAAYEQSRPEAAVAEAEAALDVFERLGAVADADAAAAQLRRLGVRPRSPRPSAGELTERERQVLELVAKGLSNGEIGARLHISRKTAAHHVSSVLTKVGARNRAEAVARLIGTD